MMCASTVQVAALPGEVVSNTGKEQKRKTEGRSVAGAGKSSLNWGGLFFDGKKIRIAK